MSGWLWSNAAQKQEKAQKQRGVQDAAVSRLRELLNTQEGALAAKQLVQGGELSTVAELTSDSYLRRWLTGRNWDVPHTRSCILKHAAWRVKTMPNGYIDEALLPSLADKKTFLQGLDVFGRPIAITQVRRHLVKNSSAHEMALYTCYVINAMVAMCDREKNPGCRLAPMFDLTDTGLANLDFAGLKIVLDVLTQHYIEVLDVMIMYNPPLVFWGLWNSFKLLLPEATRSRIIMVDPADLKQLQDIVPPNVLPVEYGGQAQLLPVDEAVRAFKLPPFPHLPGVDISQASQSGNDAISGDPNGDDATADIADADEATNNKGGAARPLARGARAAVPMSLQA